MATGDPTRSEPARTALRALRLMAAAREASDGQVESVEGDGTRSDPRDDDGADHGARRRELVGVEPGRGAEGRDSCRSPSGPVAAPRGRQARAVPDGAGGAGPADGAGARGWRRLYT